jgi:hypothetical protein
VLGVVARQRAVMCGTAPSLFIYIHPVGAAPPSAPPHPTDRLSLPITKARHTLDSFISHTWCTDSWRGPVSKGRAKTLALVYHYQMPRVMLWCCALSLCICLVFVTIGVSVADWPDAVAVASVWVAAVTPVALSTTLVLGFAPLTSTALSHTGTMGIFLDKACIYQGEGSEPGKPHPLKMAGIANLANFIAASNEMLVLWDADYFKRLWC